MIFFCEDAQNPNERISKQMQMALASFDEASRGLRGKGNFPGWDLDAYRGLAKKSLRILIPKWWAVQGILEPQDDGHQMANIAIRTAENNDFTAYESLRELVRVINASQGIYLSVPVVWHGTLGGRYHSWALEGADDDIEEASYQALTYLAAKQPITFWMRWEWYDATYKNILNIYDQTIGAGTGSSIESDLAQLDYALSVAQSSLVMNKESLKRIDFLMRTRCKAKWLGWQE